MPTLMGKLTNLRGSWGGKVDTTEDDD